MQRAENAR